MILNLLPLHSIQKIPASIFFFSQFYVVLITGGCEGSTAELAMQYIVR
jgi:hypothetical protein